MRAQPRTACTRSVGVLRTLTESGVTWSGLAGGGKSRKLSGKSGTSMQVRFALVRGQLQSPWSQPVVVTFP